MKSVYIFVGVSGSGKSTFAAEYKKKYPLTTIISSDQIRKELWGDESCQKQQGVVWNCVYNRLAAAIKDSESNTIMLDATNIERENRKELISFIHDHGALANAIIFTIPKDTCIARDASRQRTVGKSVIEKQLKKYQGVSTSEGFDNIYEWGDEGWKIVA